MTDVGSILRRSKVATRLPAQDLDRARRWYADKLGLEPVEERPGGLRYECAGGVFVLFASAGAPSGDHTQMAFTVDDDLGTVVADLRRRGVEFLDYDAPGMTTVDAVATIDGNYPSAGRAEKCAWFHDCEGNLLGIGQPIR